MKIWWYLAYIGRYMYNLKLYQAENIWNYRVLIAYFAPSMTMKNLHVWISPLSFDTRILILFVDFLVAAWLVNHSISCHSVNPLLIFSAISIGLCVDGKCCRKRTTDWLFGKTTMQSIKLSINWLDAYLIAWLINQSGERSTMHLLILSYIRLIAIMSSWLIGWLVRTSTKHLINRIVDWIHGWASNQSIEWPVIRLSNWSFTVYPLTDEQHRNPPPQDPPTCGG